MEHWLTFLWTADRDPAVWVYATREEAVQQAQRLVQTCQEETKRAWKRGKRGNRDTDPPPGDSVQTFAFYAYDDEGMGEIWVQHAEN